MKIVKNISISICSFLILILLSQISLGQEQAETKRAVVLGDGCGLESVNAHLTYDPKRKFTVMIGETKTDCSSNTRAISFSVGYGNYEDFIAGFSEKELRGINTRTGFKLFLFEESNFQGDYVLFHSRISWSSLLNRKSFILVPDSKKEMVENFLKNVKSNLHSSSDIERMVKENGSIENLEITNPKTREKAEEEKMAKREKAEEERVAKETKRLEQIHWRDILNKMGHSTKKKSTMSSKAVFAGYMYGLFVFSRLIEDTEEINKKLFCSNNQSNYLLDMRTIYDFDSLYAGCVAGISSAKRKTSDLQLKDTTTFVGGGVFVVNPVPLTPDFPLGSVCDARGGIVNVLAVTKNEEFALVSYKREAKELPIDDSLGIEVLPPCPDNTLFFHKIKKSSFGWFDFQNLNRN